MPRHGVCRPVDGGQARIVLLKVVLTFHDIYLDQCALKHLLHILCNPWGSHPLWVGPADIPGGDSARLQCLRPLNINVTKDTDGINILAPVRHLLPHFDGNIGSLEGAEEGDNSGIRECLLIGVMEAEEGLLCPCLNGTGDTLFSCLFKPYLNCKKYELLVPILVLQFEYIRPDIIVVPVKQTSTREYNAL